MDTKSIQDYFILFDTLVYKYDIPWDITSPMLDIVKSMYQYSVETYLEERYTEPMLWIGMYIALASLYCVLAMTADLLHGLRSRKLWFPCKYFTINALSLTVIAVAMKLPVDLSGSMPGVVDQVAKLGSMAFICTMMANLLPCLATMDNNELLTNITALGVLVITLVVNVCIEIQTGVVTSTEMDTFKARDRNIEEFYNRNIVNITRGFDEEVLAEVPCSTLAVIYMTFLLFLLIIHVCSSLAILKSKQIIESKYQQGHETASKAVQQSSGKLLTIEKLQQLVNNYWIMAGSGSPQFYIACSPTTTASGVICVLTAILHTLSVSWSFSGLLTRSYGSAYKWSILLILVIQFIGVVLGTIAPLSRCFATLSFKVSIKDIFNRMKVFRVEKYWTQKLYEWKYDSISFLFRSRRLKVVVMNLKSIILNFSIKLQEGVVIVCKIIALIPFFFMICVLYCLRCLKWLLHARSSSPGERTENLEQRQYVLQVENEKELADRTLKGLTKSMTRFIKNSETKHPKNLMHLIKEKSSTDFQGVRKFDKNKHQVLSSPSKEEYQDCWSLPVVTLTTIAINLPKIEEDEVKSLLKSVSEGLTYVTIVEKKLNATDDYITIRKAAERLWEEVDFRQKWLGIKLKDISSQVSASACEEDATMQIVKSFLKESENKIKEIRVGSTDGNSKFKSICASSMYRITKTIIDEQESHKKLFDELSSWIADIMGACLTNLPQVIKMKCHTDAIEKRVTSVQDAAQLLGETKQIINTLHDHDVPPMNPDDLPFIDKWCAYSSDP